MYLLPKENLAMNKIIDFCCQRCDIFTDLAMDNTKQQIDDFLRFMEVHINKLKSQKSKKPRVRKTHMFYKIQLKSLR